MLHSKSIQYIPTLNALRGLAALLVVLFHTIIILTLGLHLTVPIDSNFIQKGYLAVDLFFVLSGFILMHVYGQTLQNLTATKYWDFLKNRLARLYPVHLATLLFLILLESFSKIQKVPDIYWEAPFSHHHSIFSILTNLFMVQAWNLHPYQTWNYPAWSISSEWFGYLLAPFLIREYSRLRGLMSPIASFILPALFLFGMNLVFHHLDLTYNYGNVRMLIEFCMGLGLYKIYLHIKPNQTLEWLDSLLLGLLLSLILFGTIFAAFPVTDFITVLLCSGLILTCALPGGRLQRLLSSKPLFYIGEISYSIYLTHFSIVCITLGWLHPRINLETPGGFSAACLLILLGTLFASCITYHYLEIPGRAYLRQKFGLFKAAATKPQAVKVETH